MPNSNFNQPAHRLDGAAGHLQRHVATVARRGLAAFLAGVRDSDRTRLCDGQAGLLLLGQNFQKRPVNSSPGYGNRPPLYVYQDLVLYLPLLRGPRMAVVP